MSILWDGVTRADMLDKRTATSRSRLADAAKAYDWDRVLRLLSRHKEWVNTSRPDGTSLFAPLHQAGHGGAPEDVVRRLLGYGAWRTLRNARGERPLDVATKRGHRHLREVLEPELRHRVPVATLQRLQAHFHAVIRGRIDGPFPGHGLRLPELEPLLELDEPRMWFAVPGMYGGFSYRLEGAGPRAMLVSESWSRIAGGSGQRHEVTADGSRLVDEGFV